jgi:glycosyltransferase involved in cell wall biosynthesis
LVASLEGGEIVDEPIAVADWPRPLRYYLGSSALQEIIEEFQPDIVNAHFATGYGDLAARALSSRSIPLALTLWGSDILIAPQKSSYSRAKVMRALTRTNLVLADSQMLLDAASRLHPFSNGKVVGWGIDKEFLRPPNQREAQSQPLRVIVPRAHESVYNNKFILSALADLLRDNRVSLTVPSFGSLSDAFRSEVTGMQLPNVEFYERTSREEFMALLAAHDLYVSAALSDSSPVSLIEAMGVSLDVLVGDIEGVREWTEPQQRFDLNSHLSLAQRVESVLEQPESVRLVRRRSFEKVAADGVFEQNVARTIELFRNLAAGRSA